MRAFWIAGYAAWEGYRAVSGAPSLESVNLDLFKDLIAAFETVVSSDNPELEPLPPGVAEPGQYPDKENDPQGRAAAEFATIAVAWAFLHELRHIHHQREGTAADPEGSDTKARHDEEFSCDAFATKFLLERIDAYCANRGAPPDLVCQKRQLGIHFCLFAITLLAKDKWGDSATHPAVQRRIDRVSALMTPRSEMAAAIAHVAFASLGQIWLGVPRSA
jgi:hypothetical protein